MTRSGAGCGVAGPHGAQRGATCSLAAPENGNIPSSPRPDHHRGASSPTRTRSLRPGASRRVACSTTPPRNKDLSPFKVHAQLQATRRVSCVGLGEGRPPCGTELAAPCGGVRCCLTPELASLDSYIRGLPEGGVALPRTAEGATLVWSAARVYAPRLFE